MRIVMTEINGYDPVFQKTLKALLYANCVAITFQKVNGDIRTIVGTTSDFVIPQDQWAGKGSSALSSVCPVFDIHVNGWRSFRWDSIISVAIQNEATSSQ